METTKKAKTFDAVKVIRDTTDKISAETAHMTFTKFKEYIQAKLMESQVKPVGK